MLHEVEYLGSYNNIIDKVVVSKKKWDHGNSSNSWLLQVKSVVGSQSTFTLAVKGTLRWIR